MNNPDKHKPLSAEELFKLLGEKDVDPSSLNDLDDFEKEALEGFSAHSSVDKARALTKEIDTAISTAVTIKRKKPASKIVWFSAAASVIILIVLSVFYLTEATKTSTSNLALNKDFEKPQKPLPLSPAEAEAVNDASVNLPAPAQTGSVHTKNAEPDMPSFNSAIQEKTIDLEGKPGVGKGESVATNREWKDGLKQRYDKDDKDQQIAGNGLQAPVLSNSADLALKEEQKNTVNDEIAADKAISESLAKEAMPQTTVSETEKTEAKQMYAANASVSKKEKQKDSKNREETKTIDNSGYASGPVSGKTLGSPAATKVEAYYNGGILEVKHYIIDRLKKKGITGIPGTALYKISLLVYADGKIKVNTITTSDSKGEPYIGSITEALNSMPRWNAAVKGSKPADSNTEIELQFSSADYLSK